ncbi:hybrid sensor histidine kinase/response regulator [Nostoc sp. UHCC 0870]|uniref:hybrid sensor histidine kinase/response regulator n=1 Tax=Nostoc sp. UHCC 0870 TaxID=2914041 RepID=UPI001EDDA101|nr:hybrid sensor histidine kinase/response regulator [Nostoc sp. UHCC 0870]UKO99825.1 hybrid sensor histidine kinase/response regulator [Nostoc sp. UHCC 0870]
MITDTEIREQGYIYFLAEAPDLLQTIEQELLSLSESHSTAKVHNLMRATHTIKGGAATVGLELIKKIAHSLEDIFKSLYSPEILIDFELHTLLYQAYECLKLALNSELTDSVINDKELLQRASLIFIQIQEKLGDNFGKDTYVPTSQELGFDIVQSIFESGVKQRLENIHEAIKSLVDNIEFVDFLTSQAEVFIGLSESLNLPGFEAISQAILAALKSNPTQVRQIAEIALVDLQQAQTDVLAGDRTRGGSPSTALLQLGVTTIDQLSPVTKTLIDQSSYTDFSDKQNEFYQFLITSENNTHQGVKPETAKFYLKAIHYIFCWFSHESEIPVSEMDLDILISNHEDENYLSYVDNWLKKFLEFIRNDGDSESLCLYRQGMILIILFAIAKFQYARKKNDNRISFIKALQNKISLLATEYKKHPPVTAQEKNWCDSPKLQELLVVQHISKTIDAVDSHLLESIWGEETSQDLADELVNTQIQHNNELNDNPNSEKSLSVIDQVSTDITERVIDVVNDQIEEKSQTSLSKRNQSSSFIRVDVDKLQRINYLAGELLVYQKRRALNDEQIQEILERLSEQLSRHQETLNQLRDLPLQMQSVKSHQTQNFASVKFDSLEMDVYTEFHLTLHESIEETLQLQETTESIDLLLKQASQISDKKQNLALNLLDNLVEARMLPFGNILNRFPQMVQQLGNVYHKQVELRLTGTGLLIDKAIAEKLYDPLLQLVRNAFDHGIESPQVRRERGKPETGVIEICAYHQGSQTVIEVRDDGQGLSLDKIRKKAVELNLHPGNAHWDESDLLDVMFAPGFSTVDQVSEISGRGMGLDIVRSQLQILNASILVQSQPNQGTTFIFKIPFSMTTDQLMLVQSGGVVYALLLDSIEKIVIPTPQQIKEIDGKKVLHCHIDNDETMVSLYQLSDLMSYNGSLAPNVINSNLLAEHNTEVMNNPVLLLRHDHGVFALEVDQIIGEQELVIRPLGTAIAPPKYIYGCSSLANGTLILVIDGALFLQSVEMQATLDVGALPEANSANNKSLPVSDSTLESIPLLAASKPTNSIEESHRKSPGVVLVVDDAISLRQTVSLTLQKSGYQVIQAQHGIEALEQLQRYPQIQAVISDLEMPRMNGFELLSHIRNNPTLAKLPVVILTSRSAEKHRQLAQELGAQGYLTKPYLEHDLLATVERLINTEKENLNPGLFHSKKLFNCV